MRATLEASSGMATVYSSQTRAFFTALQSFQPLTMTRKAM